MPASPRPVPAEMMAALPRRIGLAGVESDEIGRSQFGDTVGVGFQIVEQMHVGDFEQSRLIRRHRRATADSRYALCHRERDRRCRKRRARCWRFDPRRFARRRRLHNFGRGPCGQRWEIFAARRGSELAAFDLEERKRVVVPPISPARIIGSGVKGQEATMKKCETVSDLHYAFFSKWPPNWYRMAESSLSANSSEPREVNR